MKTAPPLFTTEHYDYDLPCCYLFNIYPTLPGPTAQFKHITLLQTFIYLFFFYLTLFLLLCCIVYYLTLWRSYWWPNTQVNVIVTLVLVLLLDVLTLRL